MASTIAYTDATPKVTRKFTLTTERTERLRQLAEARRVSESQVVERALDLYFTLADLFKEELERQDWYRLSESSLSRLWDNEQDAIYDNWRELYGVSER